jgi:hypothetical protein
MYEFEANQPTDKEEAYMNFTDDPTTKGYKADEVTRILKRALRPDQRDTITHQELLEIASELGIASDTLNGAITREMAGMDLEEARKKWLRLQRSGFNPHLWSFIIVITALFLIDLFTPGGWWFQWPMLGWGIGLTFHFRSAYFPQERKIDRGAKRILAKSEKAPQQKYTFPSTNPSTNI